MGIRDKCECGKGKFCTKPAGYNDSTLGWLIGLMKLSIYALLLLTKLAM